MLKRIIVVIGARPQFIKHYPLELASKDKIELITIHTGQHYDAEMSQVFFDELEMCPPNYMLNIGSGNHGNQTGKMLIQIEEIVLKEKPDGIVVYGDTNSTLAGALVSSKLHIPLIHIEAGLRSFNKKMPEEVNRVLSDHISDFLYVTSQNAVKNLKKEGIKENVFIVGDLMQDLLGLAITNNWTKDMSISVPFVYATIHRPYNTDIKSRLEYVLQSLNSVGKLVIFPLHPRTVHLMKKFKLTRDEYSNIRFISPQGYINNLSYLLQSDALITDSGGMQKEAYWLKKKCITIRTETEWVETLKNEWNKLVFDDLSKINKLLNEELKNYKPLYGDSKAAEKIVNSILKLL